MTSRTIAGEVMSRRSGVSREGGLLCCFDSPESYGQAGRDSCSVSCLSGVSLVQVALSRCALARKSASPACLAVARSAKAGRLR